MNSRILAAAVIAIMCAGTAFPQHETFTTLLREHVKNGAVDYVAMKKDKRFAAYLNNLQKTDPTIISDPNERLAFWINAYNAFTIKLIVDHWPVKSIREIDRDGAGPWELVWVEIAGKKYSLDGIEHEIIRKEFDEPRIHAALVCAAESCPPLRSEAYTGKRLDAQLEDNMNVFLRDTTKNKYDQQSNTLFLSEVFNWFGADFAKKHGSAVQYVLKTLRLSPPSAPAVKYLSYSWNLNTQ